MNTDTASFPAAPLLRRIMAIFYDIILLTAILFLATALFSAVFNNGEALDNENPYTFFLSIYLAVIIFLYFSWFWTHGGQTLGMKTWKIRLVNHENKGISWKQSLIREVTAIFSWGFLGLGFIWSIFDKKKRSWHDISSDTRLIDLR